MTTWYAQNTAAWSSITWNDDSGGGGNSGSPSSYDTVNANGYSVDMADASVSTLYLTYSGGGFWSSKWYALLSMDQAFANVTWNSESSGQGVSFTPTGNVTLYNYSSSYYVLMDGVDCSTFSFSGSYFKCTAWYARSSNSGISSTTWNGRSDGNGYTCYGTPVSGSDLYANGYTPILDADGYVFHGTGWKVTSSAYITTSTLKSDFALTVAAYGNLYFGSSMYSPTVESGAVITVETNGYIYIDGSTWYYSGLTVRCKGYLIGSNNNAKSLSSGTWYALAGSTVSYIVISGATMYLGNGAQFGSTNSISSGTLTGYADFPATSNVKKDVVFDDGSQIGTLESTDPGESYVQNGTTYKINGVSKTGSQPSVQAIAIAIWNDTSSPNRTLTA